MIVLGVIVFLTLIIIGCSSAEKEHFEGYGVETWQDGDKLTIKTDNSKFCVEVLPKELSTEEEAALRTWTDILSVRISEKDEHLEKIKAEAIIKLMIENFAACLKTGEWDNENILIGGKEIKKAVMLLNQSSPIVADKFAGNWDGHCSISELNKFINYPETSFQVRIVRKMIITYSSF